MVFEVKNKIALITGGASGIGLSHAKQLLKSGAQGVVIADNNKENGETVVEDLKEEFGSARVIFVLTNVADFNSFENAFKVTIEHYKYIDILINNAGIFADREWRKEVDVNLIGHISGMILGLEKYLQKYRQGEEAVILNTASIVCFFPIASLPIYSATKYGIMGLTICWGNKLHYERTKVRVLAICPSATETSIKSNSNDQFLLPEYAEHAIGSFKNNGVIKQSSDHVSEESLKLLEKAPSGTIWIVENSQPTYEYKMADRNNFKNNHLN